MLMSLTTLITPYHRKEDTRAIPMRKPSLERTSPPPSNIAPEATNTLKMLRISAWLSVAQESMRPSLCISRACIPSRTKRYRLHTSATIIKPISVAEIGLPSMLRGAK